MTQLNLGFGYSERNTARELAKKVSNGAEHRYGAWVVTVPKSENETLGSAKAQISDAVAEHGFHYSHADTWQHDSGKKVNIQTLVQKDQVIHFFTN